MRQKGIVRSCRLSQKLSSTTTKRTDWSGASGKAQAPVGLFGMHDDPAQFHDAPTCVANGSQIIARRMRAACSLWWAAQYAPGSGPAQSPVIWRNSMPKRRGGQHAHSVGPAQGRAASSEPIRRTSGTRGPDVRWACQPVQNRPWAGVDPVDRSISRRVDPTETENCPVQSPPVIAWRSAARGPGPHLRANWEILRHVGLAPAALHQRIVLESASCLSVSYRAFRIVNVLLAFGRQDGGRICTQ